MERLLAHAPVYFPRLSQVALRDGLEARHAVAVFPHSRCPLKSLNVATNPCRGGAATPIMAHHAATLQAVRLGYAMPDAVDLIRSGQLAALVNVGAFTAWGALHTLFAQPKVQDAVWSASPAAVRKWIFGAKDRVFSVLTGRMGGGGGNGRKEKEREERKEKRVVVPELFSPPPVTR